jgi:hypothetical protein
MPRLKITVVVYVCFILLMVVLCRDEISVAEFSESPAPTPASALCHYLGSRTSKAMIQKFKSQRK